MSALLVAVQETANARADAELAFRQALADAHPAHSWREIAQACGLSIAGVRYLVLAQREEKS